MGGTMPEGICVRHSIPCFFVLRDKTMYYDKILSGLAKPSLSKMFMV